MKWKCRSCRQWQKSEFLGFFFHRNFNCDKCVKYVELMETEEGHKDFIKKRDALVSGDEQNE